MADVGLIIQEANALIQPLHISCVVAYLYVLAKLMTIKGEERSMYARCGSIMLCSGTVPIVLDLMRYLLDLKHFTGLVWPACSIIYNLYCAVGRKTFDAMSDCDGDSVFHAVQVAEAGMSPEGADVAADVLELLRMPEV